MDGNGMLGESFPKTDLLMGMQIAPPLGAAMAGPIVPPLTAGEYREETGGNGAYGLTESEKEHVLFAYRDAATADEAAEVLDEQLPNGDRSYLGDAGEQII